MTLPFCADLTLMMILSVVCQAQDGTIVDVRADMPIQPSLGLFSTPQSQNQISSFSSSRVSTSIESNNDNDDNDKNNNDRIPYCDNVPSGQMGPEGCGDRKDMNENTGLFPCGNGKQEEDWRDCNGDEPDNLNNPNRNNDNDNNDDNDNDDNHSDEDHELIEDIGDDIRETFD